MFPRNGHLAVVRLMLESGADKEYPVDDGSTPLLVAAWNGHLEVVKQLLEAPYSGFLGEHFCIAIWVL